MQCLEYSKLRLAAFLEEIERLKGSEFPYPHSEHALNLIGKKMSDYLGQLRKLGVGSDAATIRAACAAELTGHFEYLPVLGFILRSTNPRNPFEVYGPLLRLAREVVQPEVKLIFSSEWDYSPLTYLGLIHLPNYVLIGLPAHESGNPLLLPLAAHELGHSIWVTKDLSAKYDPLIEAKILADIKARWADFSKLFPDVSQPSALTTDFFAQQTWSPAAEWGARQAEEIFCDMVGLRLFGESYLHAFEYLLAPRQLGVRSFMYPNLTKRVDYLIKAAVGYQVSIPPDYKANFEDEKAPNLLDRQQTFLLWLADSASSSVADSLTGDADKILKASLSAEKSNEKVTEILNDFRVVAPATGAGCLANILNAGWKAFHDPDLWKDFPQIKAKEVTLKELILKSIEVFEYEQLLKMPL